MEPHLDQDHPNHAPADVRPLSSHEDTLGGIEGSLHVGVGGSAFPLHHHQSASLDTGAPASPEPQSSSRYTPPISSAPSLSRPASRMSNPNHPDYRQSSGEPPNGRNHVVIKVGMVGDAQIGKTSLMVKYVEGSWDEDYIQTLGVNFMEKTISIRNTEITFSIWDLGGQREAPSTA
ncbi:hypothetical protein CDD82_3911 [Ophiocordyceps australis]|uniref:Uncharacterized protein n=1 Tax=Ophiocordyceps australis TaxID=1399860 RepID=A0A2C5YEY5_9HYPO|nr:hypothetical protein CDD82_3911 [Ophiocordyceps australis]